MVFNHVIVAATLADVFSDELSWSRARPVTKPMHATACGAEPFVNSVFRRSSDSIILRDARRSWICSAVCTASCEISTETESVSWVTNLWQQTAAKHKERSYAAALHTDYCLLRQPVLPLVLFLLFLLALSQRPFASWLCSRVSVSKSAILCASSFRCAAAVSW